MPNIKQPNTPPTSKNQKLKSKNYFAFTLVELIVVIVILAILATIAFLSFNSYSSNSRDSVRLSDINNINKSLEMYNINAAKYPDPTSVYMTVVYSGGAIFEQGKLGDTVITNIQKISKKPIDPLTDKEYIYSVNMTNTSYQLKADMESKPTTGYNGVGNYKGEIISGNEDNSLSVILNSIQNLLNNDYTNFNSTYADEINTGSTVCFIKGNFNGLIEKTNTGNTNYILAVPGLVISDTGSQASNVNVDYNTLTGKVLCNGYNYPCIITYTPTVVYTGTGNSVPTTSTDITNIMTNLQSAYSGSNAAATSPVISNLLNSTGTALVSLGSSVVSKVGVGSVGSSSVVNTPVNSCSGNISDSNGISTATGEVSGVSWHYSNTPGVCSWNCKSGYNWDGVSNSCVLYGSSCTNPGLSCKDILDKGTSSGNGNYCIKPDTNPAFQVYCDMTTDGEGWTMFGNLTSAPTQTSTYFNQITQTVTRYGIDNSYNNIISRIPGNNQAMLSIGGVNTANSKTFDIKVKTSGNVVDFNLPSYNTTLSTSKGISFDTLLYSNSDSYIPNTNNILSRAIGFGVLSLGNTTDNRPAQIVVNVPEPTSTNVWKLAGYDYPYITTGCGNRGGIKWAYYKGPTYGNGTAIGNGYGTYANTMMIGKQATSCDNGSTTINANYLKLFYR